MAGLVFILNALPVNAADNAPAEEAANPDDKEGAEQEDADRQLVLFGYATKSQIAFGQTHQNWSILGGGTTIPIGQSSSATFEASREARTTAHYTRLSARYEGGSGQTLRYYVEAAVGSGAPIRENWALSVGGSRKLDDWIAVTLDTRLAQYDLAATQGGASTKTATPGMRINPSGTGVELAAKWINFWDQDNRHRQGFSLSGAYYYGNANYLFAGMARYPETDSGITRTMKSLYAGVRHELSKRLSVRLTAEQLIRERSYRQHGLTLGLELRL